MRSAGTSARAPTTNATKRLKSGTSLDGDLAVAPGRPAARFGPTRTGRLLRRGDPVLVDDHQRRDELALGVEEVDLRGGRHHVRKYVADPRTKLVDQLDDPFAVARHQPPFSVFPGGRANRTRSSPPSIEAPAVSRRASTRGSVISRRELPTVTERAPLCRLRATADRSTKGTFSDST